MSERTYTDYLRNLGSREGDDVSACYNCGLPNGKGPRELRPYGPNGQDVCFACMMADPEKQRIAREQFVIRLAAAGDVAVIDGCPVRKATEDEEREVIRAASRLYWERTP